MDTKKQVERAQAFQSLKAALVSEIQRLFERELEGEDSWDTLDLVVASVVDRHLVLYTEPHELVRAELGVYEEVVGNRIVKKPTREMRLLLRRPFAGEYPVADAPQLQYLPVMVSVPGRGCGGETGGSKDA